VIVEGKIKPETYTVTAWARDVFIQGRLHPQDRLLGTERSQREQGGQDRQEGQIASAQPGGGSSEPPFICPMIGHPAPGQRLRYPQLPCNLAPPQNQRDWRHFLDSITERSRSDSDLATIEVVSE
jgi:hypothetical protein